MSQDRRVKERRSFTWEPYLWVDMRKTIIKAGRREQERRASRDRRVLNKLEQKNRKEVKK